MVNAYTVLVVDDEPPILRFLRTSLTAVGYRVVTAEDAAGALAALADEKPAVDRRMPMKSSIFGFSFGGCGRSLNPIRRARPIS
jgi:CheY-like chemotaxis protein